jgi:hypothetical protein
MSRARRLAAWVGDGRPVTANGVLRRAEIAEAGKAAGVAVPARVRSAADVDALNRPWLVAQAAGLLVVDATRAAAGPGTDDDPLRVWLAGLDAVLRAESHDRRRSGAELACRLVLTVLAADPPPAPDRVEDVVHGLLREGTLEEVRAMFHSFRSHESPADAALGLLADFGAVDGAGRLTPLGRWAARQIQARAEAVTPDLDARELLTRLAAADENEAWTMAMRWKGRRPEAEAAGELLRTAAAATPAERAAAVDVAAGMGGLALPAWREVLDVPGMAAHARAVLGAWGMCPEPDEAQRRWLAAEHALVTLAHDGVEAAYYEVSEHGGLAAVQSGGHPDERVLREAVDGFDASGRRPRVFQLKIALRRVRPATWRRVLTPASATLGDLHEVIRAVLGWGDSHLHAFTAADGSRYADGLDDHIDEDAVRLSRVLPRPGAALTYVYDFGDWWEHTIILEKIVDADPAAAYPTCTAGRGDAPIEDWHPDDPEEPTPFDRDGVNRRLAALARTTRPR